MSERKIPTSYPHKDRVLEAMFTLKDSPCSLDVLSDTLWNKHPTPLHTHPALRETLDFLKEKKLVINYKGKFRLTEEGKNALDLHPNYRETTNNLDY